MRVFWLILGYISLGFGGLGVALPLVPATPFVILSVFCFAKSSPALHEWLLQNKTFGKAIRDWGDHRAISRKGKLAALAGIASSLAFSLIFSTNYTVIGIQAVVLVGAAAFILTRNTSA